VSQFSSGATEGVQEVIREAQELGVTSVILDLRNNPGGLVFEAMGIASQFLPNGTPLYQEMDAEGNTKVIKTVGSNGVYQEGSLVVLVNQYSASASEIVSSSLMEAERAPVLGEKTFGTGTVLLPFELSDGSMAVLGTELWLTGEGNQIYKEGVEPTETVEMAPETREALPILYTSDADGSEISEDAFAAIEDAQLQAAWDELQLAR
jgi:carboxyl-terminal processing protease